MHTFGEKYGTGCCLFIFLFVACFLPLSQGTLGVDGIRYASLAENVLNTGNYFAIFDEYSDQPYVNKPPFLFWFVALSFRLIGLSTFSARLPAVLFAAAAVVGFFLLLRKLFDERFATLAVLLFVGNSMFFRSVVDLSFEGMVLCGGVALFGCGLFWLHGKFSSESWMCFIFGLMFLLASKPPYVAFLLLPLLYAFQTAYRDNTFVVPSTWLFITGVAVVALSTSWLWFLGSSSHLSYMITNQLVEPFMHSELWWKRYGKWLGFCLIYFAPVSFIGVCALAKIFRSLQLDPIRLFLLLWIFPLIPIVLFAETRARYLLLPLLGWAVLSAEFLLEKFSSLSLSMMRRAMIAAGFVILVLLMLGTAFHSSHPIIVFLRSNPALFDQPLAICSGTDEPGDVPHPSAKRTEMLIKIEFRRTLPVFTPREVLQKSLVQRKQVLADKKCYSVLQQSTQKFQVFQSTEKAFLLQVSEM